MESAGDIVKFGLSPSKNACVTCLNEGFLKWRKKLFFVFLTF